MSGCGVDIDVVEPGAGAANDHQAYACRYDICGHLSGGPHDQRMGTPDGVAETLRAESELDIDLVARFTQFLQAALGNLFGHKYPTHPFNLLANRLLSCAPRRPRQGPVMTLSEDIELTHHGRNRYGCNISENYWLVAGPNGGFLAALLAHAGDTHLAEKDRQLRGLTVHYLRPPDAGAAEVSVDIVQRGRSVAFLRLEILQHDRTIVLATGSWAFARSGLEYSGLELPESRPPAECSAISSIRDDGPFPIHQQWEMRSITDKPFGSADQAALSWWIRPPEHAPLSGPLLVAMADALPPPIFMVATPRAGVPTVDLTVHIRANLNEANWNVGDYVLARFVTTLAANGFLDEEGELWTADGTLLASSRQLALSI